MRLLTDNSGKGQLEVLSVLAEEPGLKQKEITEKSSLSKGSVSFNTKKLKEKGLITEDSGTFEVNQEKILSFYREHLEEFLIRKQKYPEELNEIRTMTKKEITEIFEIHKDEIWEIIEQILSLSRNRSDIESLNSVFKETDRAIREYVTSKDNSDFRLIAIVTDTSYSILGNIGETDNLKKARKILEEANKQ